MSRFQCFFGLGVGGRNFSSGSKLETQFFILSFVLLILSRLPPRPNILGGARLCGQSRFTLPQNRFRRNGHSFNSSLRDALLGADELVIRKAPNAGHASRLNATDTMDHSPRFGDVRRGPTMCSSPQLAIGRANTSGLSPHAPPIINTPSAKEDAGRDTDTDTADPVVYRGDREASLEARRLASYPAGQPRDESTPSAIERYDWPAPASSAVVLAELSKCAQSVGMLQSGDLLFCFI
ncbi:unnamed protein product [Schistocephalus solidus]|uniref:Uncharacterized protein n=1 Tax=Schistocephalus solidus TaxID=70667 RepID=A0A183TGQ1_SCHSO|nr:unnamed protein product [Schistocephalus solidus]